MDLAFLSRSQTAASRPHTQVLVTTVLPFIRYRFEPSKPPTYSLNQASSKPTHLMMADEHSQKTTEQISDDYTTSTAAEPWEATWMELSSPLMGAITPRETPYSVEENGQHIHIPREEPADRQNDNIASAPAYRIETKKVFICTHQNCDKKYSRLPDLHRHHRGAHLGNQQFKCRKIECGRAIRGFTRRDKRDTHERRMHSEIGNGFWS